MRIFGDGGAVGGMKLLAIGVMAAVLAGCTSVPPEGTHKPSLAQVTQQSHILRDLPAPKHRVAVAVYDFPDLTGQYKERENVQTLSRAVTQGGANMLIKALQDAGERRWFTVLDRARLDDLLKERQIVTEMRRIYRNEQRINPAVLPPLDHAGIIMQGGITGYDTNTMTGGIGARYLGIGGDSKWQLDTVTVTLRAVSTYSGEVLATVSVHKMIASRSIQGGVFSYIALDRLLEAEAGVTQNEPKQVAVQQAIEKAVVSLIIEGAELDVWSFADRAAGQQIIADYRREKYGPVVPANAQYVPQPNTPNPAAVVDTVPYRPRVAAAPRPAVPKAEPAAPIAPPPPAEGEVVGSISPPAAAPAADLPPPPAKNEVVGSIAPDTKETASLAKPTPRPVPEPVAAEAEAARTTTSFGAPVALASADRTTTQRGFVREAAPLNPNRFE